MWNDEVMSPFEREYAWHVPGPLDVEAMGAAARLLEGRHDFAAFQATGSSVATTEREIFESVFRTSHPAPGTPHAAPATWHPAPHLLCYEITGTGFLRHMVRIIVGSLVEVGRGRRPVEWIAGVIAARDRTLAGPTAPPQGLFLVGVEYGDALAAGS
jgi:tRNA pseudouridine38-40 synthase